MNLSDYHDPDLPIDNTPRRPQDIAAAKRRRPTHQTEPIQPLARPARQYVPVAVGAVVVIALMIGMVSYQLGHTPTPLQLAPTALLVDTRAAPAVASPAATTAPEQAIAPAYAAPEGALLGPVDLHGEVVLAVGRAGQAWVQLERSDHTRVWFKRADLPSNLAVPGTLPDLTPPTPAPAVAPHISDWTPPAPAEPPPEPTIAPTPAIPTAADVLKVRTESDCNAEHGRCAPGDK